jgi:hypothetical protein
MEVMESLVVQGRSLGRASMAPYWGLLANRVGALCSAARPSAAVAWCKCFYVPVGPMVAVQTVKVLSLVSGLTSKAMAMAAPNAVIAAPPQPSPRGRIVAPPRKAAAQA